MFRAAGEQAALAKTAVLCLEDSAVFDSDLVQAVLLVKALFYCEW